MPYRDTTSSNRAVLFVALGTSLLSIVNCAPAFAWGSLGHRVTSEVAELNLAAEARAAIASILEPGEALADASTWADEHRRELPKTAPWHYVNVPLDQPEYGARFSGVERNKGCIVAKINELRAMLKDRSRSIEDRKFALRFLVHLVEDMQQPLHVGDNHDQGGNRTQVRFYDRGTNMHQLWDSDIIERVSPRENVWLLDLASMDTPDARVEASKGTVEDWATESLLAARGAYQVPGTGERLKSGQKLGDDYHKASLPVVRERIYRAGVRLARVLNDAFVADDQ